MNDGVYPDLSFEDYLECRDRLSRSGAIKLLPPNTPADYMWGISHPSTERDPMRFGTAIHTAILEPDEFDARHTCFSMKPNRQLVDVDKARAKGSLTKAETLAEEESAAKLGKSILPREQWDMALLYRDLVHSDEAAHRLLAGGKPEVSILATDPVTGVAYRTRMDWGLAPTGLIVDVKSTASLTDRFRTKHMADLGYDLQATMIRDACRANDVEWAGHVIIWCRTDEKKRPAVLVELLTPGWLRRGELLQRRAFRTLAQCTASGEWPGDPMLIGETPEPRWLDRWLEDQESIEESEEDFPDDDDE